MLINKLIILLISCSLIIVNCQELRPDNLSFYIRNFKHDRNPDFDIGLSNNFYFIPGIMTSVLPENKRPEYCCGESSVYDPNGILLVNNENTFNEWFNSEPGTCDNYLETFTVPIGLWDEVEIQGEENPFYPLDGIGFGNANEFPEYSSDPYNQFFCFEAHFSAIPAQPDSWLTFKSAGEIWVYVNNQLVIDQGGYDEGWTDSATFLFQDVNPPLLFDGTTVYPVDIYSCARASQITPFGSYFYIQGEVNLFCSWVDDNGVCNGDQFITQCLDDTSSCTENTLLCGACSSTNRTCDYIPTTLCSYPVCLEGTGCTTEFVDCDDFDPCTIDSCNEIIGCSHIDIPNCRCNASNCFSEDACYPKICLDDDTCIEVLKDCSIELPECLNPICEDGECNCLIVSTTTTTSTIGTPTTTTTTSTIGTTSTTGIPSTTGVQSTSTTSTTSIPTTTTTTSTIGTTSSTISTTSTTGIHPTTSTTSTSTTTGVTKPPIQDKTKCDKFSCPRGYNCIQLHRAFTCVSDCFLDKCNPERLGLFY